MNDKRGRARTASLPLDNARNADFVPEYEDTRNKKIGMLAAWKQWPKCVFCIVGNEFCERFNYYGMRTVLFFYLLQLGMGDKNATVVYHAFAILAYFTPLLGAYLADGFLGKFTVILWLSLLYAAGSTLLAVASVFPWLDLLGLFVIAVGTGGIKPCVAPFGADQFSRGQEALIEPYFGFFYASINAGSLLSTNISPILAAIGCFGAHTCYPAAFGVPAVIMVLAVGLFLIGSRWYKRPAAKENIYNQVANVIWQAIKNRRFFTIKRDHWLDHYMDSHNCLYDEKCVELSTNKTQPEVCQKLQLVKDIKGLFRVVIMISPIIGFWALYDQQGSRWLIQTAEMDYRIGSWTMPPAIVQAINPILILAFIPLFQGVVYPAVRKCGINPTPLRRMSFGLFVITFSFVMSGFLQLYVNTTLPPIPSDGQLSLSFVNTLPCDVRFESDMFSATIDEATSFPSSGFQNNIDANRNQTWKLLPVKDSDTACHDAIKSMNLKNGNEYTTKMKQGYLHTIVIGRVGILVYSNPTPLQKSQTGSGDFLINIIDMREMSDYENGNGSIKLFFCCRGKMEQDKSVQPCNPTDIYNFLDVDLVTAKDDAAYRTVKGSWATLLPDPTEWMMWIPQPGEAYKDKTAKEIHPTPMNNANFTVTGQGGIFLLVLYDTEADNNDTIAMQGSSILYRMADDNSISILLQIPQIAVVTAAEILVSISGLELSYSQAAPSMKSLVQAAWLLTVSFGDLIILLVTEFISFDNLAIEMFAYAGFMLAVTLGFCLMSIFYYKYSFYEQEDNANDSGEKKNDK